MICRFREKIIKYLLSLILIYNYHNKVDITSGFDSTSIQTLFRQYTLRLVATEYVACLLNLTFLCVSFKSTRCELFASVLRLFFSLIQFNKGELF